MKKILLSTALALTAIAAGAQTTFYWHYDEVNKEAYVRNHERWHDHWVNESWTSYYGGCHSYGGDVVVPDTAPNGYPVVGIWNNAFVNCDNVSRNAPLTSITLPKTLRTIGERAFLGCNFLKELVIPEGVDTIGKQAFYECKGVVTLTLPSTLKLIDEHAFNYNQSLRHLTIPASVDSIGYAAFMHLDSLRTLTIEDSPETLHFDRGQLYGGEAMFSLDHQPCLTEAYIGRNTTTLGSGLFENNDHLRRVTFGDLVTYIRHDEFRYCDSLHTVTFGKGLKEIGNWAFEDCDTLQEILLPEGVEYVAVGAFEDCRQAKRLSLPSTLKLIDQDAFRDTHAITDLTIPASVDSVGRGAFRDMLSLERLTIADGETTLHFANGQDYGGEGMFGHAHQPRLTDVHLGRNTTSPSDGLFAYSKSIRSVVMSDDVTSVRHDYFRYMDSLRTVRFSQNLREIGNWAFEDCDSLQAIDLPDAVETMGVGAFEDCRAAKRLHIPTSLRLIDQDAFRNIDGVTDLFIPANVDSIGRGAFMDMDGLKHVVIEDGETTLHFANGRDYGGEAMFAYDHQPLLEEAYVGRNYTSNALFAENKTLRQVTMNNVPDIKASTFSGCTALEEATLGSATLTVARQAFYNCQSLKRLTVNAVEPPVCTDTNYWLFYNVDQEQCLLAVPEASIEAYKTHDVWKNFYNIGASRVDAIEHSPQTTRHCYSLGGHRLATPQRGLNIMRMDDGTVRKVIVR